MLTFTEHIHELVLTAPHSQNTSTHTHVHSMRSQNNLDYVVSWCSLILNETNRKYSHAARANERFPLGINNQHLLHLFFSIANILIYAFSGQNGNWIKTTRYSGSDCGVLCASSKGMLCCDCDRALSAKISVSDMLEGISKWTNYFLNISNVLLCESFCGVYSIFSWNPISKFSYTKSREYCTKQTPFLGTISGQRHAYRRTAAFCSQNNQFPKMI